MPYCRADLDVLKTLDRSAVFAALGSFDDRGMDDARFAAVTLRLFDPRHLPALAAAAGDPSAAAQAVMDACAARCDDSAAAVSRSGAVFEGDPIAAAEEILAHRFTFYGETHQLPAEIDWDHNPGTAHWGHDLNRFTYLHPLVEAYVRTGDTRFSRKAVDLILDWIAKCDISRCFAATPYAFGSYLNNALHSVQWCRALARLLPRGQVRPLELLRILKSMHDQAAYLEVVTNGGSGNWILLGVMGLMSIQALCPLFAETQRWVEYSRAVVRSQVCQQVLPDGVQFELAPHYHYCVMWTLTDIHLYLRRLGLGLCDEALAVLRKMTHYLQQTIMPDGSRQAVFNDGDPAAKLDYRGMLREAGLESLLSREEDLGPEAFPYAGVCFLRQARSRGDLYLAFDAGPFGASHQHEDKLGFWLFAYGRSLLVDPGRHLYDWSPASYYTYLRSTAAHSTIRVDGQGQHSSHRAHTWISKAPIDLGWRIEAGQVRARGEYDLGYGLQNEIAVAHAREIVLVAERFWIVFDRVSGQGVHRVESRFQFAPGAVTWDGSAARTGYDDANLLLWPLGPCAPAAHVQCGDENPRGGWYSDMYGRIEPAPALSLSWDAPLPLRTATLLWPYRGTCSGVVEFTFDGTTAVVRSAQTGEHRVTTTL